MKPYLSTLRTTLGYIQTRLEKALGLSLKSNRLETIYNYYAVDIDGEILRTSGQPTEPQFATIARQGITTVLNLAPADAENALKDEAATLSNLGLKYVHIPVNFHKPAEEDFELFVSKLKDLDLATTWVHCAANMRVSAFIFRYRIEILKHSKRQAESDLHQIWSPFGNWIKFVNYDKTE